MSETLCAIVLAAGLGSRYRAVAGQHRNKLLAQCLGRGPDSGRRDGA